ncbi:hypothetical protein GBAR_LOCUS29746 [Geodia barretti]|uniref:Uncharacterized protein n=1 Tax=Geodia barretti TaxID=519541 RepID=A0AA35XJV5_GEOBA|nr:hypothetical protein GBAR_LOCUS29746 [Geodia barretti]
MYHAQGPEVILLRIFSYAWQSKKDLGFYDTQFKFDNVANVLSIFGDLPALCRGLCGDMTG